VRITCPMASKGGTGGHLPTRILVSFSVFQLASMLAMCHI
jgi:hypothetical protein